MQRSQILLRPRPFRIGTFVCTEDLKCFVMHDIRKIKKEKHYITIVLSEIIATSRFYLHLCLVIKHDTVYKSMNISMSYHVQISSVLFKRDIKKTYNIDVHTCTSEIKMDI